MFCRAEHHLSLASLLLQVLFDLCLVLLLLVLTSLSVLTEPWRFKKAASIVT